MHSRLPSQDVVLLGVGHTNAHILRMWRMQPMADAQLTCISDFSVATYSGMLPGVLAGQYPPERMQIDLVRLCAAAGVRLITEEVTGLDPVQRQVLFTERPPLPFDVVSIGIGSVPRMEGIDVEGGTLVPIKPMQTFIDRLAKRLECWQQQRTSEELRVVVVGGGAGGVEITFCLPDTIRRMTADVACRFALIHSGESLVPGSLETTHRRVAGELESRGVELHLQSKVQRVAPDHVELDNGHSIPADVVIWATGAAPPPLLSNLNLPIGDDGFLLTRPTLKTTADAPVFVVGDTGTRDQDPTPKAGVYAVRQGPVLWENIHRQLNSDALREYQPQRGFLKLLNTGDNRAIAEYKRFSFHNGWAWKLKDWIDGQFMDKYQDYEPMAMSGPPDPQSAQDVVPQMRCGGCGGKIGGQILSRVLARLDIPHREEIVLGLDSPDDAAVIRAPQSGQIVVTTDFFTAPLNDPYLVGRIAALNAASDAFAMGAKPVAALAIVSLPEGSRRQQEETLFQLLAGGLDEFRPMGATLAGGHTIEGEQLMIGYTIFAEPLSDQFSAMSNLKPGDALLLTKPLGTGVLLAAHMQGDCRAESMNALRATMLASNEQPARVAIETGVRAMTDVTGFGLAGHLLEMLRASNVAAEVDPDTIPLLPGVTELLAEGVESTLAPANRDVQCDILCSTEFQRTSQFATLFDPQTSGGLLIGVPSEQSQLLIRRLEEQTSAKVHHIGQVLSHTPHTPRIRFSNPD